jgi:3-deoxy-D-manno-octulosonic-acid transferase
MGARVEAVRAIGNLKYDVRAAKASRVAELIREAAAGRPIVVAGSTVSSKPMDDEGSQDEENFLIQAWEQSPRQNLEALLVLAPRHPERFGLVEAVVLEFCYLRASDWSHAFADAASKAVIAYGYKAPNFLPGKEGRLDVILLNTIGDLAAVYGVADVAFVGGSLVRRGGHNPLEPAQFGVPVVMGASFENFRDVVGKMIAEDGIRIVQDKDELETALVELLTDGEKARAMGERGRRVFEEQQGATGRAVAALVGMVRP